MLDFVTSTVQVAVVAFVSFFVALIPNADLLPATWNDNVTTLMTWFAKLNTIVPVDTLFTLIQFILIIEVNILLFKLILWLIKIIRG